ncbi:MAG: hypothetical protein Q4C81_00985 [Kocuria sp.]|nr:hypothetical protein [Kocuria sp.]
MTFGVAFGLHALLILGVSQEQADKMAAAILAGMDIAAAVALFGGPAAIGGWILFLIRRAVGQGSKRALVA